VNYFPVFFDLTAQQVLVVGAGEVALRKVELLLRSGAAVTVVAPEVHPELMRHSAAGLIKLALREFVAEDLAGARLVIVATSHRALNRWIAKPATSPSTSSMIAKLLDSSYRRSSIATRCSSR
jgi:siroheme synthase-like protein